MNAHTVIDTCPCCGQVRPPGRSKAEAKRLLGDTSVFAAIGQERVLIDYFVLHFGQWVPRTQLIDALYADDVNGGPDNPANIVGQVTHRIRAKVERLGLLLEGKARWGTRLRWRDPRNGDAA